MKKSLHRVRGWLTHEDILLLEEASKRKLKYPKKPAQKFICHDCNYSWYYSSVKCPVCASKNTEKAF